MVRPSSPQDPLDLLAFISQVRCCNSSTNCLPRLRKRLFQLYAHPRRARPHHLLHRAQKCSEPGIPMPPRLVIRLSAIYPLTR
jgi:hypothetical protein